MLLVPSAIFEMIECRLSSLLGRKKIELERNKAYSFDRKLTHGCKDNKPAVNDDSSNESSPRRSKINYYSVQITYPERASWEVSIFSFFGREKRKETPHACKFEM